jgi:hypothetical protein
MERSPSREAIWSSVKTYPHLWTWKFITVVTKTYSSSIFLARRISSTPTHLPNITLVSVSLVTHACHMPCSSHPLSFGNSNNICWRVQIMKLLVIRGFPTSPEVSSDCVREDVHKLCTGCPQVVHTMSTSCPQDAHKMSVSCAQDVHKMSPRCRKDIHKLSIGYP